MPKQRVYGTPVGIPGGGSERPSGSQGRQKPQRASDAQVKATVKKEMTATGRNAKAAAPTSSGSRSTAKSSDFARGVDAVLNPGKRTKKAIDDMGG